MSVDQGLVEMDAGNLQDMISRLAAMKNKLDIVQQFFREIMIPEVDYGTIPGTPKPTLYKSGAEKLCELYGFAIEMADKREERDYKTGFYLAELTVRLRHRGTGQVVAEGVGEANVYEAKYRWRWVSERDLPKGIDPANLMAKEYSNKDGTKFKKYRVENADLFDVWNTVLKMAKKRALVDAALSATRSSGIFSQSEGDFESYIMGEDDPVQGAASAPKKAASSSKDLGIVINFGKHKGKTLGEVFKEDDSYIEWLAKNAKEEKVREACNRILNPPAEQGPERNHAQPTQQTPPSETLEDRGPTSEEEEAYWASLRMEDE